MSALPYPAVPTHREADTLFEVQWLAADATSPGPLETYAAHAVHVAVSMHVGEVADAHALVLVRPRVRHASGTACAASLQLLHALAGRPGSVNSLRLALQGGGAALAAPSMHPGSAGTMPSLSQAAGAWGLLRTTASEFPSLKTTMQLCLSGAGAEAQDVLKGEDAQAQLMGSGVGCVPRLVACICQAPELHYQVRILTFAHSGFCSH